MVESGLGGEVTLPGAQRSQNTAGCGPGCCRAVPEKGLVASADEASWMDEPGEPSVPRPSWVTKVLLGGGGGRRCSYWQGPFAPPRGAVQKH